VKRWAFAIAILVLVTAAVLVAQRLNRPPGDQMHWFEGVRGPGAVSRVTDATATRISEFEKGGPHRLAILVTDPDSGWLGLVRGFRALGVPITVTEDVNRALKHRVVLVYPIVSGQVLEGAEIRALANHVRSGGSMVAFNLAGGGLEELFGVRVGQETSARTRLSWTEATGEPEADEIVVSGAGEAQVGSIGYEAVSARVIARFADGTAGVTCRTVGGEACLLGVDLGSLAQRSMNGRAESLSRTYVNGYEPSLDTVFRWLRDVYVAGEPMPWLISSVPTGREVSILFTHDIDFGPSVTNAAAFAKALEARGAHGTFFVQTKYMKDYNDDIFFDDAAVPLLKALVARGHELGSHTVAHSGRFEDMALGTGRESYPAYRPRVTGADSVDDATIMGELRVSKFLLEETTTAEVQSFRPGRLSYPFSLPQAMNAAGYRYSSSITANIVLTHLPFQLTSGRADGSLQPVFEFPVTLEDELPPRMGDRLAAGNDLIEKISRHQGVAVILTHPNITDHKLRFVEGVADHWRGRAWMGTVAQFGKWWSQRDALETDVTERSGRWYLQSASNLPVEAVTITLPKLGGRRINVNAGAGRRETPL
jgi:peptidoglycan/xylan/chitin deacetylase (PgdA/CDA1 family)